MAIANLLIKIGADIAELKTGADKATRTMEQASGKIDSIGSSIKKGLAGYFSAQAILDFGKSLLDMADNVVRTADQTGLLISEVQKLDYIASQSGNSLDDLTGAIGQMQKFLGSGDKAVVPTLKALGLTFADLKDKSPYEQFEAMAAAIAKIPNPTDRATAATELFQKAGLKALPSLIANFEELGKKAPIASDNTIVALDKAGDQLAAFGKTAKVWAAEAYNYLSTLFDKGTAAIFRFIASTRAGSASLLETIQKIPGSSKVFGDLSDNIKSLRDSSQYYTDAAKAMDYQIDHAGDTAKKTAPAFQNLGGTTKDLTDAQKKAEAAAEAHTKSIQGLRDTLSGGGTVKAAQDLLEALKKMPPVQKLTAEAQAQVNKTMGEALDVFKALGVDPPDAIREVYQATFKLIDTIPLINRWKQSFSDVVQDGFIPLKGIADKLAKETWPTSIAGIDGYVHAVENARKPTHEMSEEFQRTYNALGDVATILNAIPGKFAEIAAVAARAGQAIAKNLSEGNVFGAIVAGATAAVTIVGKLLGIGPTEYEKRMKKAAEDTAELQKGLIAAHGSMQQLIADADIVGINIKAAFDWKDPDAFKQVIDDLNSKTKLLNDAMQEYGFTWEDMGEKARNAKLSQLFDELFAKTDILRTAGIDYHEILTRQADDYSKLVQSAIRTGTEIPAAMQPVLQDLVDMGLLVDENGQAFTDLSKITWAKTLTQGFDEVTAAINKLADAITNGVGGALNDISSKTYQVHVKTEFDSGGGGGEVPEYATGTRGQFVDFGGGQYVKLHGREAVVTESEALGVGGGDIYVSIGNTAIDAHLVRVTRREAGRGGLRTRAASGRSY